MWPGIGATLGLELTSRTTAGENQGRIALLQQYGLVRTACVYDTPCDVVHTLIVARVRFVTV